jgi:hypothetical protein
MVPEAVIAPYTGAVVVGAGIYTYCVQLIWGAGDFLKTGWFDRGRPRLPDFQLLHNELKTVYSDCLFLACIELSEDRCDLFRV